MSRKPIDTVQLKVRMREALRAKLEQAAEGKGISLNAEVVDRLERSFERGDIALEALGGPDLMPLLVSMRPALSILRRHTGSDDLWTDPRALVELEATFYGFFQRLRESAPNLFRDAHEAGIGRAAGQAAANLFLGLAAAYFEAAHGRNLENMPKSEFDEVAQEALSIFEARSGQKGDN